MSSHADTIRSYVTMTYPSVEERNQMYAALDALLAENQRLREDVTSLQGMVDDLFERNGWAKIGWKRPPEHIFEYFRKLHGEALAGDAE